MAKMIGKTQWTHGCKWRCCTYPQHKSSSKRQEEREWRNEWLGVSDHGYDQWLYLRYLEEDDDYPIDFDAVLGEGCFFGVTEPVSQTLSQILFGDYRYLSMLHMMERPALQRGKILWLDPLG